jgi:hypothetical protein
MIRGFHHGGCSQMKASQRSAGKIVFPIFGKNFAAQLSKKQLYIVRPAMSTLFVGFPI